MTNRILLDSSGLTISKPGVNVIGLTDQAQMAFSSNYRNFKVRQEGQSLAWVWDRSTNPFGGPDGVRQGWTLYLTAPTNGNKYFYLLFAFQLDGETDKFRWGWTEVFPYGSQSIGFVVEVNVRQGDFMIWVNGNTVTQVDNFHTRLKFWYTLLETDVPVIVDGSS